MLPSHTTLLAPSSPPALSPSLPSTSCVSGQTLIPGAGAPPGAGVPDLPAQPHVILAGAHQKGEQSRPFCAGAAPTSVLLLHTPSSTLHPQPQLEAIWLLRDGAGQEGSREAGRWPAPGKVVRKDPAFPSRAPCCWDRLIPCLAEALDRWPLRLRLLGLGRHVEAI